jgi:predicted amidohydrolase YtcJ
VKTKPFLFSGSIKNCYDSHVHWRATGSFANLINLSQIRTHEDIHALKPIKENFIGNWLVGYGWDQNTFHTKNYFSRLELDQKFLDTPVYFRRVDGHAAWLNTAALKACGLWQKDIESPKGGQIFLGDDGYPTGILLDLAMNAVEKNIPAESIKKIKADLLSAQNIFHRAGFTHIRDLTCDDDQWQAAIELDQSGELQLYVEQFFSADDPSHFQQRVDLALKAKNYKSHYLKAVGVKVYFDGALGSEGALISRQYASGSGNGLQLLDEGTLLEMIQICFKNNLDLAVHAIGDEAAHKVVTTVHRAQKNGFTGKVHLEHAELLRPETIVLMQNLNIICHIQPCHWLSDKKWLHQKIGDLDKAAFQWRALEDANIQFDFGSDSPIEKTSIQRNFDAIFDAAENGISAPASALDVFHTCKSSTAKDTYTQIVNGEVKSINFNGQKLF